MVIKELYLKGYKRFFLNNIEELWFKPESKVQLILGSNGSGKSSLLSMLNPLPPDLKKDFKQDGMKIIDILHNGKMYRLSSCGNKHNFICNNKELNVGNTKKVQLDLVYEHFNLDIPTMNILLDNEKFCEMNSTIRRSWLTKACKTDFNYAINIFNKIKSDHRDKIGAMKLLTEEIDKSKEKILKDEEINFLKKEKKEINNLIEYLLSCLDTTIENNVNIKDNFNNLKYYNREISKLLPMNDNKAVVNSKIEANLNKEKEINSNIEKLDLEIINYKKRLTIKSDLSTLLKELSNTDTKILNIENEIKKYEFNINKNNIKDISNNFVEISTSIVNILNKLEEYNGIDISINILKKIENDLVEIDKSIKTMKYKINMLTSDIEHMDKLKDDNNLVMCEKCGYKFYNKYDENKLINFKKELKELNIDIEIKSNEYRKLTEQRNIISSAHGLIKDLKELISSNPSYSIYKYVINNYTDNIGNLVSNIPAIISGINMFSSLLNNWTSLIKYYSDKENLTNDINTLQNNELIKRDLLNESLKEKEKEIEIYIKQRAKLYEETRELLNKKDIITKIETLNEKIEYNLSKVNEYKTNSIVLIRNDLLKSLIKELKEYYLSVEEKINSHDFFSNKLKKDQETLDSIKKEESILNKLLKSLSPNDGLISKNIGIFLDIIIAEMNELINSVWSYSMVINNVNFIEGEEITYKFNVLVDNKELIDDVSKLSSSMKEIVNLAFKITIMKYLGLTSIPLYMDEFGSTMDDVHRDTAYNIIDKTLSMDFEQIFIISHYESSYGRFINSDITVLDSSNLLLSKDLLVNRRLKLL